MENNKSEQNKSMKEDDGIEWDGDDATYGHAVNSAAFKRKDSPDEAHQAKTEELNNAEIRKSLKNSKFVNDADIASQNKKTEKGVGGRDL
jgi:hypothetical protein